MRNAIFKKALEMVPNVQQIGYGVFKEYWRVQDKTDNKDVTFENDSYGTMVTCTCSQCSIHSYSYLCSYKIAVLIKKISGMATQ